MKTALQIMLPIVLWLGAVLLFSEDKSDVRYFLILPFALVAAVAALLGFILFVHWLY